MTGFRLLGVVTQNVLTACSLVPSILLNIPAEPRLFDSSNSMLKLCGFFILYLSKKQNPMTAQGLSGVTA